jgi:hypothetical protein
MLKGILGFEHIWSKYEGLLEVIPFGELSNVDPNPLAGRNGIVYRAEWICPQKIHMASPERMLVKTLRATGGEEKKDFLNEVCSQDERRNHHASPTSSA